MDIPVTKCIFFQAPYPILSLSFYPSDPPLDWIFAPRWFPCPNTVCERWPREKCTPWRLHNTTTVEFRQDAGRAVMTGQSTHPTGRIIPDSKRLEKRPFYEPWSSALWKGSRPTERGLINQSYYSRIITYPSPAMIWTTLQVRCPSQQQGFHSRPC